MGTLAQPATETGDQNRIFRKHFCQQYLEFKSGKTQISSWKSGQAASVE